MASSYNGNMIPTLEPQPLSNNPYPPPPIHHPLFNPASYLTMSSITILYFASIRTHLNLERETIPFPPALPLPPQATTDEPSPTIGDLPHLIYQLHPSDKIKRILEGCMWSVDEEMVDLDDEEERKRVLIGGQTVAVIPPVSGG